MLNFEYVITDEVGLHARPAGMLVKEVAKYQSGAKIILGEKEADASKLFALMQLGIKHGDEVEVLVSGADEVNAVEALKQFFAENL